MNQNDSCLDEFKCQFKLVAVKPLKGCAPHIRKILKEDTTYFFYNDFEIDPNNEDRIRLKDACKIPIDFFRPLEDNKPLISISAVVGKNGDGKSSIIELILRVLNNLSYSCGFISTQEELQPIDNLYATLYYSIGENNYSIKSEGNKITIIDRKSFQHVFSLEEDKKEENLDKLKQNTDLKLFYTQISNYSLYAFNAIDLKHENVNEQEECWITGLFNKNDGYQTPIVLNPWRVNGNIDANKDSYLNSQRLLSLYIEDKDIRIMDKKQQAKFLIFNVANSKFLNKTIKRYFYLFRNNAMLYSQIIDIKGYLKFPNQGNFNALFESHITCINDLKNNIENYFDDFVQALNIIEEIEKEEIEKEKLSINKQKEKPELEEYLDLLLELLNLYIKNNEIDENDKIKIQEAIKNIKYLEKGITNTEIGFNHLSINAIQRVLLVITIRKHWFKKHPKIFNSEDFYDNTTESKAKQYIIYKTISIFQRYKISPKYKNTNENISQLDRYNTIFNNNDLFNNLEINCSESFKILFQDIEKTKSHITLKLRQTLNFLLYNQTLNYIKEIDRDEKLIGSLKLSDKNLAQGSYMIDFDEYNNRINSKKNQKNFSLSYIEFLPPPIFETNIIYQDLKNREEYFLLSELSSGERQLLNNISSVIYHLKNINSVDYSTSLVKYEHVNLIFEEIELYFHPEYQRKFIFYLLNLIQKANLTDIKSINICFVTHSPFILSDIPKNNVLFLKDGLPVREMQEDTFGANIHTLLQNGFFLNSVPIGDFAKEKINALFKTLHAGKTYFEGKSETDFHKQLLLVSEPFIRTQLLKLYNELQPQYKSIDTLELQINEMKKEIEILKKQRND